MNHTPIQLSIDLSRKYSDSLMAIYYLFGIANTGKTTVLARLAFNLSLLHKHTFGAKKATYNEFQKYKSLHKTTNPKKKDAFPDIRLIVHFGRNQYAYIATPGDDIAQTEANINFFEGKLNYEEIYILEHGKLRQLSVSEINYYKLYRPTICISSCRTQGLAELPLQYFAAKKNNYTRVIQWIKLEKARNNKRAIKNNHRKYSSYILENIKSIYKLNNKKKSL